MTSSSTLELALFAAASLGIVLSSRVVLRMMRSRAAIARKSHRI
ncbi:hypothetical protein [Ferrovibrio terrae]|nr:hypothetical protein [Ferrovibrio terrae]